VRCFCYEWKNNYLGDCQWLRCLGSVYVYISVYEYLCILVKKTIFQNVLPRINSTINEFSKSDSQLSSVKKRITYYINKTRTDYLSQFRQRIWPTSHFFWQVLPVAHFGIYKNLVYGAFFEWFFWIFPSESYYGAFDFKFLILSTNSMIVKMIWIKYWVITTTQFVHNSDKESLK